MKRPLMAVALAMALTTSCKMNNPLLNESALPYQAPEFDKIKTEQYFPAFEQAIKEAKSEIDAIVACPDAPDFFNTIEALEHSGKTLSRIGGIFYNLLEADTNDEMQDIAEKISPLMTDFEMYVSLNGPLFEKVKAVHDNPGQLEQDQQRILDKTYRSFKRNGALLSEEDKAAYGKLAEELSLLTLKFSKNALAATNAFKLHLTDEAELEGLPQFVREMGAQAAKDEGGQGWIFNLTRPSYGPFMQYSSRRDLREKLYMAYNTKSVGGEFDNTQICKDIIEKRIEMSQLLGYATYADFAVEDRMVKSVGNVNRFIKELLEPSLPVARKEVAEIEDFARTKGFEGQLQAWDFAYWSEKYKAEKYELNDELLKPYFRLENCIEAVFGLATKLYGISFEERKDIPVYHKDVKVYDVKDTDGSHLALYYVDFFPRESKRGGAWMTEFRGQSIENGVERRPLVSIVCNFSKPTDDTPSLLTHDELTTFMHEFGHSLHGMLTQGRYESITGTSVDHDFVELPSQIMENWAFEAEFLKPFAKHYQTGETIPDELIEKIIASKNYLAAYGQVRQLQFGILDMAWHTQKELTKLGTIDFEKNALKDALTFPDVPGTCISTTFSHIFAGGYSAGYYSYKWAEVLEADAYSLFQEKGIFNPQVAKSFRDNILSKGSSEDEAVLYRKFRGHDPEPKALLKKLGIVR